MRHRYRSGLSVIVFNVERAIIHVHHSCAQHVVLPSAIFSCLVRRLCYSLDICWSAACAVTSVLNLGQVSSVQLLVPSTGHTYNRLFELSVADVPTIGCAVNSEQVAVFQAQAARALWRWGELKLRTTVNLCAVVLIFAKVVWSIRNGVESAI